MNGYDSLIFLIPMLYAFYVMHTDIFNNNKEEDK